jgi:GPI ethanolamine phosphate transferase 3 subunit O
LFTGDHIWLDMFGNYFDEERHYPSYNVRDLDTNDKNVAKDLKEMLNRDYDLLVCHLIGIDHAGHTFHANHTEIERKIKETNDVLKGVID